MAWENTTRTDEPLNARAAAVIEGGGAVVERADTVSSEGRSPTLYSDDGTGDPPLLETTSSVEVIDCPLPDTLVSGEARIVIDGNGDAGRLEIRDHGWIGYDGHKLVGGWFEAPPRTLLDHGTKRPTYPDDGGKRDLSVEEWGADMDATKPRTSAEYDRATRSRDGHHEEDDH